MGLIVALSFGLIGCSNGEKDIIAKVEDETISKKAFDLEFEVYKSLEEREYGEGAMATIDESTGKTREDLLKDNILEMLIMHKLVLLDSQKDNLIVDKSEIDSIMNDYVTSLGGEEAFLESLAESKMTREFLEDSLERSLLIEKHKENYINKAEVTEDYARDYFEENKDNLVLVKASHILLKSEEEGQEILEKLANGQDFEDLAMEFSADLSSGMSGGSLGYFGKGNMILEFEEAAFALNVGEISGLVKTEVGYHIIRLDDKKDSYESLKEELNYYLRDQMYYDYLEELRDNAKIKILL